MPVIVPDEMIPRLKQLWNAGLTAIEVAEELGLAGDPPELRDAVIRARQTSSPTAEHTPQAKASIWTPEKVEKLKALHADRMSAAAIADEIGGVSRSAVLGKILRLGLSDHVYPTTTIRRTRRPRQTAEKLATRAADADPMFANDGIDGTPAPEDLEIPVAQRRSMLGPPHNIYPERGPHECAWPIGDSKSPEFFFCGADRHNDRPYCVHHCMRAYRAPERRPRAA